MSYRFSVAYPKAGRSLPARDRALHRVGRCSKSKMATSRAARSAGEQVDGSTIRMTGTGRYRMGRRRRRVSRLAIGQVDPLSMLATREAC